MERAEAYGFSGAMSGAFLLSCLLFAAVSRRQRGAYMDEVFHVPQAQAYCHGRFLQVREGLTLAAAARQPLWVEGGRWRVWYRVE